MIIQYAQLQRTVSAALVAAGLLASRSASAKPEYLDVLVSRYHPYAAALTTRSCANCHVSASDFGFNPYGAQVKSALEAAHTKTLTPAILASVETLDANGNGMSNLDEIKAGKAPGAPDPNAKKGAAPAATVEKKSLVPKNAFHPAIVHFPIALFIAGLVLDLMAAVRGKPVLFAAGWYNLLFAAITTLAALATGYAATLLMHVPIAGLIKEHMLLALAGAALMWVMVAMRARRHEAMPAGLRIAYYGIAVIAVVLISYSGHLGGQFVYGE